MRKVRACLLVVALQSISLCASLALAAPLQHAMILSATTGGAFGVTGPAKLYGLFQIDSSFLDNADGNYPGTAVSGFLLGIGTQVFDQATAANANIQGIRLVNHTITPWR
jgi:hypothetical protein